MRHRLILTAQVGLLALLLVLLLSAADWRQAVAALGRAAPAPLLLAFILFFVNVAVSCWKWHLLLLAQGLRLPFGRLYRWYLLGSFANNLLPSDVGGDLGRVYYASRATGRAE